MKKKTTILGHAECCILRLIMHITVKTLNAHQLCLKCQLNLQSLEVFVDSGAMICIFFKCWYLKHIQQMDESETFTASQGNNLLSGEIKRIATNLCQMWIDYFLLLFLDYYYYFIISTFNKDVFHFIDLHTAVFT